MTTIKFQKHYVTDGVIKARVHYSPGALIDGIVCVTLYAKDYSDNLAHIFGALYRNDTDMRTDYFEKGRVRIVKEHPLHEAALARCNK